MDIIAKLTVEVSCHNCGHRESQLLSWSNDNGGSWSNGEPFSGFDAVWETHFGRPMVKKATCKHCIERAQVKLMVAQAEGRKSIPIPLFPKTNDRTRRLI